MSYPLSDNSVIVNIIPDENTKLLEDENSINTTTDTTTATATAIYVPVNTAVNTYSNCCEHKLKCCKYCVVPVYCLNLGFFVFIIIIMIITKYI